SRTAQADQVKAAAGLGARGFLVTTQFTIEHFLKQVERALLPYAPPARVGKPAPFAGAPGGAPATPGRVAANGPAARPGAAKSKFAVPFAPKQPTPFQPERPVAELLKGLKPIISSADLREKLKSACELKALSPTVARVLDLCRSAGTS